MPIIEEPVSVDNEQDLFIGANGTRPNTVITITPEQAALLLKECDAKPAPALLEAFEARKRNQAKSRIAK